MALNIKDKEADSLARAEGHRARISLKKEIEAINFNLFFYGSKKL